MVSFNSSCCSSLDDEEIKKIDRNIFLDPTSPGTSDSVSQFDFPTRSPSYMTIMMNDYDERNYYVKKNECQGGGSNSV